MAPAKVYKEKDANKNILKNKTLAVIGYGSQGHAHALNLKGQRLQCNRRALSQEQVDRGGQETRLQGSSHRRSSQGRRRHNDCRTGHDSRPISMKRKSRRISQRARLSVFLHGLSIHSGLIKVPAGINVIMVAPKGPRPHCSFAIPRKQGRTRPHRCCAGRKKTQRQSPWHGLTA